MLVVLRLPNIVLFSKIIPPFFTIKEVIFSKTYPSIFTIKEGSTFLSKPLFPQEREDVTALSAIFAPPVPPQREGPYPIPKP